MSAGGEAPRSLSDSELQNAMCSQFFFLKSVVEKANAFDVASFRRTAESLTDNPASSAHGMSEGYGPGKHWGARVYRDGLYAKSCTCYSYVGPPPPVPGVVRGDARSSQLP